MMSLLRIISIVLGLFPVLCLVQFLWRRLRLYMLSKKVPGPRNYPLIGMAHRLLGTTEETFKFLMEMVTDYPGLSKNWLGLDLFYFVSKPEYLEKVLNHPGALSRSFIYRPIGPLIGTEGLFMGDSAEWRLRKKLMAPSFNKKTVNSFVPCFNEQFLTLLESLREDSKLGEIVDIEQHVSNYVADSVSETLFNCKIHAQKRKSSIGKVIDKLFEILLIQGTRIWFKFDMIFEWSNLHKEKMEVMDKINAMSSEIFDLNLSLNRNELRIDDEHFEGECTSKFKSLIQYLFDGQSKSQSFSDENIKLEINSFLLAAIDTTTLSICFASLLLGMHPEIQAKVRSEVNEITKGRDDKTIKAEDLQRLKYTERVIKETLRLYPPASFISRKLDSDLILDDVVLAKGATVFMGLYCVQRDAKYWPDPLKFDPYRFLPEEVSKRHPYSWIAFSGGPRNCIGYRFAMTIVKVTIAALVTNFDISTSYKSVEDVMIKPDVVTKPKDGYKIFMKPLFNSY